MRPTLPALLTARQAGAHCARDRRAGRASTTLRPRAALAAGGADEPVGLAAPALDVGRDLLLGAHAQRVGRLRGLALHHCGQLLARAAGGGELLLGGLARPGEDPLALAPRVVEDRRGPRPRGLDDVLGGRLRARVVEDPRALALGLLADASRRGEVRVGAPARAVERRLGLEPR